MANYCFVDRLNTWQEVKDLIQSENGSIKGTWKLKDYLYNYTEPYIQMITETHQIVFSKRKSFDVYRKI